MTTERRMPARWMVVAAVAALLTGSAAVATAQPGPHPGPPGAGQPGRPGPDPLADNLFPPDVIMSHQGEIGLNARQRAAIMKEIQDTQALVLKVQWQLADQSSRLAHLLSGTRVDPQKALAQADRVMDLERKIKKAHLGMLIRIKNTLSVAQQRRLRAMRRGH